MNLTLERTMGRVAGAVSRSVNPRWIRTVLKDRGLPCPEIALIEKSLRVMDETARESLRASISRLHVASETEKDVALVREWAATSATAECSSPLMATSPVTLPELEQDLSPAEDRVRKAQPATSSAAARKYERSHHVYSTSGVVCFESVEIPAAKHERDTEHSIQIEMTKALSRHRYDWDNKIIFRLTLRELPVFASIVMGYANYMVSGNHGPSKDKFFELKEQPEQGSLLIKLKQGKRVIAVPIPAEELFAIGAMALKALQKNASHLDAQTVLHLVRRAGLMYSRSLGGDAPVAFGTHGAS